MSLTWRPGHPWATSPVDSWLPVAVLGWLLRRVVDLDFRVGVWRWPGWRAGGRGFRGPRGFLSWSQGWFAAGQGACGRALMRSQAVVMSAAQGQVAEVLRRRWRPPRVSLAAACRRR